MRKNRLSNGSFSEESPNFTSDHLLNESTSNPPSYPSKELLSLLGIEIDYDNDVAECEETISSYAGASLDVSQREVIRDKLPDDNDFNLVSTTENEVKMMCNVEERYNKETVKGGCNTYSDFHTRRQRSESRYSRNTSFNSTTDSSKSNSSCSTSSTSSTTSSSSISNRSSRDNVKTVKTKAKTMSENMSRDYKVVNKNNSHSASINENNHANNKENISNGPITVAVINGKTQRIIIF